GYSRRDTHRDVLPRLAGIARPFGSARRTGNSGLIERSAKPAGIRRDRAPVDVFILRSVKEMGPSAASRVRVYLRGARWVIALAACALCGSLGCRPASKVATLAVAGDSR